MKKCSMYAGVQCTQVQVFPHKYTITNISTYIDLYKCLPLFITFHTI